jgi:ABC-type sugar transport system permease subunit
MPNRNRSTLWLLVPFFSLFALFWVAPLIGGIHMSLHSNAIFGDPEFVGTENYQKLLQSPRFRTAIDNTFKYTMATIMVIVPLAVLLSSLLHSAWPRLKPFLSFILLLPGLTPPAVLALELFSYRASKHIPGMTAALSRLDALVFTGEHPAFIRRMIVGHLVMLRLNLDPAANESNGQHTNRRISIGDGPAVLVVNTDEELAITR